LKPGDPQFSFREIMARVRDVVTAIEPHDSIARYTGLGVDVVQGYATIVDPWTVAIQKTDGSEQRLTTRSIVIAAGARPSIPPLPGLDTAGYVTSDTLWERFAALDAAPRRLLILGGGPIGCELSQAFARLGSEVTLVEMADQLLGREDQDVADLARESLTEAGVRVRTGHKALRVEQKTLVVEAAGQTQTIAFDELLVAVGRSARLEGYGLEALGIETKRTVVTNGYLQTKFPNIYAAGDVAGPYQLTHVGAHQAWYAAVNALFGFARKFKADYRVIPGVTFTDPEIARVGLSEREAREQGIAYEIARYPVHELDRAIAEGATKGFIKVLTVPGKDRILGVTIAAQNAGELLAEYVLAMKYGIGLNKILGTIHSYPTMAELNKYVAGDWKKAHAPQGALNLLERLHAWRRG
jgi:pyruvate/2-oxoglutarate dehydrogenase complex dihydrolipoamide dehydrogenase (E3) component